VRKNKHHKFGPLDPLPIAGLRGQ